MKKKLLTVLITSIIMFAGMGAFLWKMNGMSNDIKERREAALDEERDMPEYQSGKAIDDVEQVNILPLYLSGDKKNVVTVERDSLGDVYDVKKSAQAKEMLSDIKERAQTYSIDSPLWAYNPYGTNNNSLYVYFTTRGSCYCKYSVSVKESDIPDFTRTLSNGAPGNVSKEHEYQIMGLVPGKTNYIVINLYNKKNELSRVVAYSIEMPKSAVGAPVRLKSVDGRSKAKLSNGLYTVFSDGIKDVVKSTRIVVKKTRRGGKVVKRRVKKTVKKTVKRYAILLYDNSGILRGEIPLDGYCGRNVQTIYDGIVYAYSDNGLAQVNSLGQVINVFKLNGYRQTGEYAYDDFGNIYVIAAPVGKNAAAGGCILKVDIETGEVSTALEISSLLPKKYAGAIKKSGKRGPDKIGINSVKVVGTNQLLVSSRLLSSIFKVSSVNSLLPKIDYIISDKSIWSKYKGLEKKVLTKALEGDATPEPTPTPAVDSILSKPPKAPELFDSQAGQNAIIYEKPSSLADGQYYISMLNNNFGLKATGSDESYYYRFFIDEAAKTYILSDSKAFDRTKTDGNISKFDDGYVYCASDDKKIIETDATGKLIREFSLNARPYRVYKSDWKGFWFY